MNEYRKLVNLYHTQQTYNLYILLPEMIQHKCTQEDNIKELRKDVQGSKERDILQSEQIAMLKDGIGKIDLKVDKIDIKIDNLISTLDEKYAKKKSVDRLWVIVWSIIGFVFTSL
jgi:hypothetical protein